MKIKVEKISDNENTFETDLSELDTINGVPTVGREMILTSSKEAYQGISTSRVSEVLKTEAGYEVKTRNSKYRITVLT